MFNGFTWKKQILLQDMAPLSLQPCFRVNVNTEIFKVLRIDRYIVYNIYFYNEEKSKLWKFISRYWRYIMSVAKVFWDLSLLPKSIWKWFSCWFVYYLSILEFQFIRDLRVFLKIFFVDINARLDWKFAHCKILGFVIILIIP